jgi:hypothetical protein
MTTTVTTTMTMSYCGARSAWRDPFDGTLRYAKTDYTIEEVEEMARQKVEQLQPISSLV